MAINYNDINAKYLQAKEVFNKYTINFSSEVSSGIISQKKIRKVNTIAMWMDYIQESLKYKKSSEYSQLDNFLEKIAIELKINSYKTSEEIDLEESLSNSTQYVNFVNTSVLEADMGELLTEGGQPIELDAEGGIIVRRTNTSSGENGTQAPSPQNGRTPSRSGNTNSY